MEAARITLHPDYSIARLVVAVISQAKNEALSGDIEAREWLAFDGVLWAEACGMDGNIIKQWIAAGCPEVINPRNHSKRRTARVQQLAAAYA